MVVVELPLALFVLVGDRGDPKFDCPGMLSGSPRVRSAKLGLGVALKGLAD